MQRIISILCVTIMFCYNGFCQNIIIKGSVYDMYSKKPLQYVSITCSTSETNVQSTTTNSKGIYIFNATLNNYYKITYAIDGYKKVVIDSFFTRAQNNIVPIQYMQLDIAGASDITVTSKKPPIQLIGGKTILNVSASPILAAGSALDVVNRVPGVSANNDAIKFRGNNITVLINGRPSNLTMDELINMLSNMPANNIDKAELIPNPGARYDAQGGAIINLVLIKSKEYGTNYTLTNALGFGRKMRANAGIDINKKTKKFNYTASYNYQYNNQYYFTRLNRQLNNTQTIFYEEDELRTRNNHFVKLGADYDINKTSSLGFITTNSYNIRDRIVDNNANTLLNNIKQEPNYNVATNGKAYFTNSASNINFKKQFDSSKQSLTVNVDYVFYNKDWADFFTNSYTNNQGTNFQPNDFIRNNTPAQINVVSVSADYTKNIKNGVLEMGAKTIFTKTDNDVVWENNSTNAWQIDSGKTNHFIYKENVNALYATYQKTIKKWSIETGLRVEQTNTIGNSITIGQVNKQQYINWFPNIGVSYTQGNNNVSFNYRKSINRFGFNYVNPFIVYQNQFSYYKGNPNLIPEIYNSVELQYIYKSAYMASLTLIKGINSLGDNYLQDANNNIITTYANFNNSQALYATIGYNGNIAKWWFAGYNVQTGFVSLNSNSSNALKTNSTLVAEVALQNSFTLKKNFSAELVVTYLSKYLYGTFTSQPVLNTSIGISKKFWHNRASIKLGITDIANTLETNRIINYNGVNARLRTKAESRFANITFRYKFGNTKIKTKQPKQSKIDDVKGRIN